MGGDVEEALPDAVLLDRGARDRRRQRDAAAERLRNGDEVGDDAVALEAEHRPEPAEPGLRLVEHEEYASLVAQLPQTAEVAVGRNDDPAGREHGLGDHRAERADRLLVDQLEARLQAGAVAGAVTVPDRAAVGIRSR